MEGKVSVPVASIAVPNVINQVGSALSIPIEDDIELMDGEDDYEGVPSQMQDLKSLYKSIKEAAETTVGDNMFDQNDAFSVRDALANLTDPRCDPSSDQFEHAVFLKAVRGFARSHHMEFAEMPIAFKDLRVYGDAVDDTRIPTVGSTLMSVLRPVREVANFIKNVGKGIKRPKLKTAKEIIHGITGVAKPGDLILVLGRPGSGCSTLLRTIANRTNSFKEVKGDISFSGFSSKEIRKYRGDIVFAEEDDPHFPSLTVRQTLDFALACKINKKAIRDRIIEVTLRLYGLVRCQNTVVGNELLRGVSGGEKKRVSLAEATCVGGSAGIFDGCTKGLDAASALDFVRGLRSFADFQNRAVVASCYQASDAMYDLFDKVIVLANGHCVYFGPASQAVAYFESLGFRKHPRDTIPEFLTTCASGGNLPAGHESYSAEALASKYLESSHAEAQSRDAEFYLNPERQTHDRKAFVEALQSRRKMLGSKKGQIDGPFSTSLPRQAALLINREWQILRGNPSVVIVKYVFNMLMAVIVGSVFYQLPTDTSGAFTRGGVIFFGLLFNSVGAFSELPKILDGRPILYKHVEFALYRASTLFLAQTLFQFFFDVLQVLLFSVVLYFMAGLQNSAQNFFKFVLTLIITQQAFGCIIKIPGYLSATKESATQKAGAMLISFVIYSGYIIVRQYMKPWFVWINYINPVAYGFQSLMINEFTGLQFNCSSFSLVPYLPVPGVYNNIAYQTCTLAGAKPGSAFVDGLDYLSAALNIDTGRQHWNLLINVGFFIFGLLVNCIILETVQHGKAGLSVKLFKAGRHRQVSNDSLEKSKPTEGDLESGTQPSLNDLTDAEKGALGTLSWSNIKYSVPNPKDRKKTLQLLSNVSAYARPGTLTALMGSSGAGKTTMLDVIAGRKTIGTIEGEIKLGAHLTTDGSDLFLKQSGYCEQMDVHSRESTVKEALKFSAYLRQPQNVPKEQKDADVARVIEMLELTPVADALIGSLESGKGLSMEERKRLTIGVELVARPKILFLDEPTSGLDSQASMNILRILRTLAREENLALVVTIHQPSTVLFEGFDRLLLLGRGGRMIYFGDLGPDCQTLLSYFERNGAAPCDSTANPAEYMLDVIGAGTATVAGTYDGKTPAEHFFECWEKSPESRREMEVLNELRKRAEEAEAKHREVLNAMTLQLVNNRPSLRTQIKSVMRRMFVSYWRSPEYNVGRITFQIIAALIIGLSFFQASATPGGAQNRVFALFMASILGVVVINLVIPMFIQHRAVAAREQAAGAYGPVSFGLSVTTAEIPFAILAATVFFLLFYWTVGLNTDSNNVGYFYLMLILFTLWAVSYGQMAASMVPTEQLAAAIVPLTTSILSLFSGVSVPYNSMPSFYKNWLYWIDPYHYFIEGLIVNDLHGLALSCTPTDLVQVSAPPGLTCGQYFAPYLKYAPGSLQDPTASGTCLYCPIQVGDSFFSNLSWSYDNRWRNAGLLLVFWLFNRFVTAYFVRRFKIKR